MYSSCPHWQTLKIPWLTVSTVYQQPENQCGINIILMLNPKRHTEPAAGEKINSAPAKIRTQNNEPQFPLHLCGLSLSKLINLSCFQSEGYSFMPDMKFKRQRGPWSQSKDVQCYKDLTHETHRSQLQRAARCYQHSSWGQGSFWRCPPKTFEPWPKIKNNKHPPEVTSFHWSKSEWVLDVFGKIPELGSLHTNSSF